MHSNHAISNKKSNKREICADAVQKMWSIVDDLEDYSGVYEEVKTLRKQLQRIERVCSSLDDLAEEKAEQDAKAASLLDGDPRAAARSLIAQLPLREVFQDQTLADIFLSELMLAVARESSYENRRALQKKGIEKAKAQRVRFGRPTLPLPENFEEVRQVWRAGQITMKEAAEECGMAESTFYYAVQRAEKAAQENGEEIEVSEAKTPPRKSKPVQHEQNAALATDRAI